MTDDCGYNKELCEERHDNIDKGIDEIRNKMDRFSERIGKLEIRVAIIVAVCTIFGPMVKDVVFPGPKAQAQCVRDTVQMVKIK